MSVILEQASSETRREGSQRKARLKIQAECIKSMAVRSRMTLLVSARQNMWNKMLKIKNINFYIPHVMTKYSQSQEYNIRMKRRNNFMTEE